VNGDATRRYKELAEGNTDAVRRMREHDRTVADRLRRKLDDTDRALAEATAREWASRVGVRLHWESVTEALWAERWLPVGPQPDPIEPPPGTRLTADQADAEVGRTYDVLRDALRRAALLPRRHS
jgi:hypothetical protein